MDRFGSINSINQRYIGQAIASNLNANLNQQPAEVPFNDNNAGFVFQNQAPPQDQRKSTLPISISEAQRETQPYPFARTAQTVGHESRIGEVMYDNGEVMSTRAKSRAYGQVEVRATPVWLSFLMPGILTVLLLVFVIACILQHRKHPLSPFSLRYYSERPELLKDPYLANLSLTENLEALNQEQVQPAASYPGTQQLVMQQLVNQKMRQGVIDNLDIQQPSGGGECQPGSFLLNGVCYPCKEGYWNGTKCLGHDLSSNQQSLSTTPSTRYPSNLDTSYIKQTNPTVSNPICKDGAYPVNGRCLLCPSDAIWDGTSCRKVHPDQAF